MSILKGIIRFVPGAVFTAKGKKTEQVLTLLQALQSEADCGFGLDYCNKALVLEDTEVAGDFYRITVAEGVVVATKIV